MREKDIPDKIFFAMSEGCGETKHLVVSDYYLRDHMWLNPGKSWHDAEEYFDAIAKREGYSRCTVVANDEWDDYWRRGNIIGIIP
jgi:hypothetical protein